MIAHPALQLPPLHVNDEGSNRRNRFNENEDATGGTATPSKAPLGKALTHV